MEKTIEAIEEVAEAKVLDVISIAPDQNAQEFFFDQENMDDSLSGAGGGSSEKCRRFSSII